MFYAFVDDLDSEFKAERLSIGEPAMSRCQEKLSHNASGMGRDSNFAMLQASARLILDLF